MEHRAWFWYQFSEYESLLRCLSNFEVVWQCESSLRFKGKSSISEILNYSFPVELHPHHHMTRLCVCVWRVQKSCKIHWICHNGFHVILCYSIEMFTFSLLGLLMHMVLTCAINNIVPEWTPPRMKAKMTTRKYEFQKMPVSEAIWNIGTNNLCHFIWVSNEYFGTTDLLHFDSIASSVFIDATNQNFILFILFVG